MIDSTMVTPSLRNNGLNENTRAYLLHFIIICATPKKQSTAIEGVLILIRCLITKMNIMVTGKIRVRIRNITDILQGCVFDA